MNIFYKKNYIYFLKNESWFYFLIIKIIFKKLKIFNFKKLIFIIFISIRNFYYQVIKLKYF